ncbi:hypothetical protein PCIT_b1200 [Pseudoalteromonas citrea]|uniref:Uncharacterized protein n=2 Tax=Pseudoalteromonas citrea TaxID=43655 RepID=A0AAD4FQH9_9GAMM|nr:DUF6058 family natural product biosynthesis protein [Pseudoalteromonas citrea]KAF7765063.1 hypothetical protein PCIT_b1200 [Pseudoalteromonas citrea]
MENTVEEIVALGRYLQRNFLSQAQLIAQANISEAAFYKLLEQGAIPKPSYQLGFSLSCHSYFGEHTVPNTQCTYYAQGCVQWITDVRALSNEQTIYAHFKGCFLREYEALKIQGYVRNDAAKSMMLDSYINEQFHYFIAGTYGVCTRTGRVAEIVKKEVAIKTIQHLSGIDKLTEGEMTTLQRAIDLLDEASAYFAPHEYAASSRSKYIDALRS